MFILFEKKRATESFQLEGQQNPKKKPIGVKEKVMSKGILEVTQEDHEKMKEKGIDDESLLKPGKYKLRRRTKTATKEDLHPSNTKVEFQMKLDLDILNYFQEKAGDKEIETLQKILNRKLRKLMDNEKLKEEMLNDKNFIKNLADEIKKAA